MVNYAEQLPVPDPSTWYYKLFARTYHVGWHLFHPVAGNLYRRPRCQFRTPDGLKDGPEPRNNSGEEKIHSTSRFLDMNTSIHKSVLCTRRRGEVRSDNPEWFFSKLRKLRPEFARPGPVTNDEYSVREEPLGDDERGILSRWAEHQHLKLYEENGVGQVLGRSQATSMVVLKEWLEKERDGIQ